ncbi:MAG: oxidoreductase [marine bacterium B5-7]|nr:MAG: oxidoreductase [marine bacterium B5-7]
MSTAEFAGRRVIITGGASGIGAAVAKRLVSHGAYVYLLDVNATGVESTATAFGDQAGFGVCNVTSEDDFIRVFKEVRGEGIIDGLVCCAGCPDLPVPAENYSLDNFNRVIDSHLNGTFIACRTVGASMIEDGGGAIVNIASVLSFNSGPVMGYAAAKAAIVNLTSSFAVQWAARNVRVNAVAPGWTDTPFLKPKERNGERDFTPIKQATPLGRLLSPSEIAEVIAFLLSPKSSAIVGTTVACDGGVIAGAGWPPYGGIPA